jgi:uncharacterized protein (DUF488 family)
LKILTIGHSTRPIGEFLAALAAHGVECLADVRSIPRSRRNPQFASENLPASLEAAGIGYLHLPGLGGMRRPRRDSTNTAWKNDSFRGYADYMETAGFETSLERLIEIAQTARVAIMCAEAVPWRCHRSLIADALTARGIGVEHIMSAAAAHPHALTPFARVDGHKLTYPGLPLIAADAGSVSPPAIPWNE